MFTRTWAALVATALLTAPLPAHGASRIVGGVDADQPYSFMTSLRTPDGEWICGGSLISAKWVVTAEHCVENRQAAGVRVRVNSHHPDKGGEKHEVRRIIKHTSRGIRPDIALLELKGTATASPVRVAQQRPPVGTVTRLLGWGNTCPLNFCAPKKLQQLDTHVLPTESCDDIDGSVEVCTDSPGKTSGACHGDSGGPQIVRNGEEWELVAITKGKGKAGEVVRCSVDPTIYTDATVFRGWFIEMGVPLS